MVKHPHPPPIGVRGLGGGALLIPLLFSAVHACTQAGTLSTAREALVRAEDARGEGPQGLAPMLDALRQPALRERAIRGLGRLERPDILPHILPFLLEEEFRATAAEAAAQSLRGLTNRAARGAADRALVDSVFVLLRDRARAETLPKTVNTLARSLARLPFDDPRQARAAEAVLVSLVSPRVTDPAAIPAQEGVAHGLYAIARARRTLGDASPAALDWLREAAGSTLPAAAPIRRVAWLALTASRTTEGLPAAAGVGDPDPQVRRLALQAIPHVKDSIERRELLDRAGRDTEAIVRYDWVTLQRNLYPADCEPLLRATRDPSPHVMLAAIDALNGPCPNGTEVRSTLRAFITGGPTGATTRAAGRVSWHARAHALVTMARVDAREAAPFIRTDSRHPIWQVRMYAARGAALTRDTSVLNRLAFDSVGNVREAAINGLSTTIGHQGDQVYVRGLSSVDYHVVLAAARALRGTTVADSVLSAVLDALDRLHRERRQTSRDPRMELVARLEETADRRVIERLLPMLDDVDPEVARRVLGLVLRLDPSADAVVTVPGTVDRTPIPPGPVRVRVTMSPSTGGGSFELLLDAENAPVTVGRVTALIRDRYYDGLTFHRVVPNFVLQGGSPGMNEYVGARSFMRDELGLAHHARGTLGISTRGRDTGDAQWFINLVDNYRLDHEYTVFATVVAGMDVVDRILEGDVMESVRVVS